MHLFHNHKKLFFGHPFFQKAVIRRPIKIFPWNQLQIATNVLNFQWKKAETIYLNPFQSYWNSKSGLNLSKKLDPFQEILVQSNKAVLDPDYFLHSGPFFYKNTISWFASIVFKIVLGSHLTLFFYYLCTLDTELGYKARLRARSSVSSKKHLLRGRICWQEWMRTISILIKGHWSALQAKQWFTYLQIW